VRRVNADRSPSARVRKGGCDRVALFVARYPGVFTPENGNGLKGATSFDGTNEIRTIDENRDIALARHVDLIFFLSPPLFLAKEKAERKVQTCIRKIATSLFFHRKKATRSYLDAIRRESHYRTRFIRLRTAAITRM